MYERESENPVAERESVSVSEKAVSGAAADHPSQAASPVIASASDLDLRRNEARKQRQQLLEQEKRVSESITASLTSADNSPVVANAAPPPSRPPRTPQVDERTLERNRERAEEKRLDREERERRETGVREAQGRRKAAQKAQSRA